MEIIKIKTDSLAQLSYIIVDDDKAVVIDPRRQAEEYYNIAQKKGATIKHIFETHRNEDFITGSRELKRHCGADIYHGKGLDFKFGNFTEEGDTFPLNNVCLKVLDTPGHTPESISLALYSDKDCKKALAVFTGDALFVEDVGRTDFFPNEMEKYAGMLYDSIHEKILPLGDHVALYPAHGAGSVCGGGIADRELSTLGHEKINNPMLQLSREEFIKKKVNEKHQMPPYFKKMEEINLEGNDSKLKDYHHLDQMTPKQLKENFSNYQVIDVRSAEAHLGCHIPGSLSIPKKMLAAYGGYFLDYDKPIILISNSVDEVLDAKKELLNLGYDKVTGFLNGGVAKWETSGQSLENIDMVDVNDVKNKDPNELLLDVRKPSEWEDGIIKDARTIFLGDIPKNFDELNKDQTIVTYCGSGKRATIAASLLKKNGFNNLKVFMGSMKAYKAKK